MSESGLGCLDVDAFGDHGGGIGSAEVVELRLAALRRQGNLWINLPESEHAEDH